MALTDHEQLRVLLQKSNHILLVFGVSEQIDGASSALSLKQWLEKQGKQVDVASPEFNLPKQLKFLPGLNKIQPALAHLQKFIIKVDTSKAEVDTLSYDIQNHTLSIYLTPKSGIITRNDLRTAQSTFKYDLIITLNTVDLAGLGELFFNNTDLFYRTPIVNIDRHSANERYGQLNFISVTATATAEIVFGLIKQIGEHWIDAQMATALLTGMIAATRSFKTPNVTPHVLGLASELITLGAERDTIIQHLYRTKSLATLKLWGQALSHLQSDQNAGLVYASITRDEFTHAGAHPEDLKGLVEELIGNSPEAKVIVLFYEETTDGPTPAIHVLINSERDYSAVELGKPWGAAGDKKQAAFRVEGKPLKTTEAEVIKNITTSLIQKN